MKHALVCASLLSILLIISCSAQKDGGTRDGAPPEAQNYAVMEVFFATDRAENPAAAPAERFGAARGEISYGITNVSIPRDHRMGELESPSIWKLEFRENPEKHVVLLEVTTFEKDEFYAKIASTVGEAVGSNAFVFVHGYNVTFETAARRTAQISYDIGFDGAPVFYSWPSQGSVTKYTVDEANIEWAKLNLRNFLEDFANRSTSENIYLIAHSMGNRALTRAYAELMRDRPELQTRFKEVILTAPDIDAEVFKREIAPALVAAGRPVTLYASSGDRALAASKTVHGNPRAGDSGEGILLIPGIETIDASDVETDFLGHSYFADEVSVISDIFYLVKDGKRANDRFALKPVDTPEGRFWRFNK